MTELVWICNDTIRGLPCGIRRVRVEVRSTKGRGRVALTLPGRTRASAIVSLVEYKRIKQSEVTQ